VQPRLKLIKPRNYGRAIRQYQEVNKHYQSDHSNMVYLQDFRYCMGINDDSRRLIKKDFVYLHK